MSITCKVKVLPQNVKSIMCSYTQSNLRWHNVLGSNGVCFVKVFLILLLKGFKSQALDVKSGFGHL